MIVAPPVLVPAVQDAEPAVKPFEEVGEWLEPVRAMLTTRFGADKMDAINALLLETGAVIAGGSILRGRRTARRRSGKPDPCHRQRQDPRNV